MQCCVGGLYNIGIGNYYCKCYWFVYLLYDIICLDDVFKILMIVKVFIFRSVGMERIYCIEGDMIYIIGIFNLFMGDDV